jgi:hypothetical protein
MIISFDRITKKGPPENPTVTEAETGKITVENSLFLRFVPNPGPLKKHEGSLVLEGGWINLYYGSAGYLAQIEIVAGDPWQTDLKPIDYLQPKNPLQ